MKQIWSILLLFGLAQMSFGQLEGPLSGTLGPGEFHVVDTISVEASDTLRLMPGTTLNFDGPYPFHIYGILLAEGAEGNLVVFTTDTSVNHDWWRGLRFIDSTSSGSSLTHCTIEFGWATDDTACYGGGVYCKRSSPRLANCVIRRNRAWFQDIHHHTYGKGAASIAIVLHLHSSIALSPTTMDCPEAAACTARDPLPL